VQTGHAAFPTRTAEPARLSDIGDDQMTLTPRETAVLSLLAHGASNKVVARELEISVHTAKSTWPRCWRSSRRATDPMPSPSESAAA